VVEFTIPRFDLHLPTTSTVWSALQHTPSSCFTCFSAQNSRAAQPTKQTRHIDIRHCALNDWVERDLVTLEDCASGLNASDLATKQTGGILFARHLDNISG